MKRPEEHIDPSSKNVGRIHLLCYEEVNAQRVEEYRHFEQVLQVVGRIIHRRWSQSFQLTALRELLWLDFNAVDECNSLEIHVHPDHHGE